jgi:hypothetical protein
MAKSAKTEVIRQRKIKQYSKKVPLAVAKKWAARAVAKKK